MKSRSRLSCVVAILSISGLAAAQTSRPDDVWRPIEVRLDDACISGNHDDLADVRNAIAWKLDRHDDAQGHYLLAFANVQLMFNGWTEEPSTELLASALEHLETASAADTTPADVYVLLAMCDWMRLRTNPDDPMAIIQHTNAMLAKAKEAAPASFHAFMVEAMNKSYDPTGPARPEGVALMKEAVALARAGADDGYTDWWELTARGWMAQIHLAEATPAVDAARAVTEEALALRPDWSYGRAILPQTEFVSAASERELAHLDWTPIGDDPSGDGTNPALADASGLAYAVDRASARVWFGFALHELPDPDAFGLNVAIDRDGDETNGTAWWGGTTGFMFDRLVTVWVTRSDDGRFRGNMGVCDADGARRMQFGNVEQNAIAIVLDEGERRVAIGVSMEALGGPGSTRVLGAVGSNLVWNDNVPDTPATLELRN